MTYCTQCRQELTAQMNFCFQCGTPVPGRAPATPAALHLDDLLYNCRQCGKEARFGELQKCSVCHDATCDDCAAVCHECSQVACTKCLLDCFECQKTGCARCFQACETCRVHAMCPDHGIDCPECGYPTCNGCVKVCKKCDTEVCGFCIEHAHEPQRR